MKQIHLLPPPSLFFGGGLEADPKRSQRILSTKLPTHLVLKSKPTFKLFKNKSIIEEILKKQAKKFGVKIYGLSVQKDHIHLNIRIFSRITYKAFIRAVTGLIARKLGCGIWKFRPFTRIVKWGRPFEILKKYILQNELEIKDIIPYQERRHKYRSRKAPL